MFPKKTSIQIDKADNIEINAPLDPFVVRFIIEHLNSGRQVPTDISQQSQFSFNPMQRESEEENPKMLKIWDYISKGVSILSGIAVIVFVVFILLGQTSINTIQVGKLLTIVSFTLVGGLVSIGGVKMISINANLRKAKDKIERIITTERGCPFMNLFDEQEAWWRRPGNPDVCIKCPLGIDIASEFDDGLIHVCSVYPILHRQWKQLRDNDPTP